MRLYTIFSNQSLGSITLHATDIRSAFHNIRLWKKKFGWVSDESVWLKSLAEHDNVDRFVQITWSASDFIHTLSSHTSYHTEMNLLASSFPWKKRQWDTIKVFSFRLRCGMADIIDSLLKRYLNVCTAQHTMFVHIMIWTHLISFRCSLTCRMHMIYDSLTGKLPSVTKFNVLCEQLDLSLTDTQVHQRLKLIPFLNLSDIS